MDETPTTGAETLAPYVIEGARSGRSRCKTCRKKIDKGSIRIGILIEGPYGTGYLWHHLGCAARRRLDEVEKAYELEAWTQAKEPPSRLPSLDKLRAMHEQAAERREQRRTLPYVEVAPSGRARCKHCEQPIPKGSARVALGRAVEFGGQVRVGAILVHPACVAAALEAPDSATEPEGLTAALRANSVELPEGLLAAALAAIATAADPE